MFILYNGLIFSNLYLLARWCIKHVVECCEKVFKNFGRKLFVLCEFTNSFENFHLHLSLVFDVFSIIFSWATIFLYSSTGFAKDIGKQLEVSKKKRRPKELWKNPCCFWESSSFCILLFVL